tara:strand:- start:545 stop:1153 length:609 start_codon:yes stop_codon:yes gene_type:complete
MTKNLYRHKHVIKTSDKVQKNGHNPCVVWLTGLSGSGKSTIASVLEKKLFKLGCQTHVLDGDNVRLGLNKDLGFSPYDRKENIRRIGEVANLFAESGTIVITAFISPYAEDRLRARKACSQKFLEVFVDTPLQVCEKRDTKGLYEMARTGLIQDFTGVTAPYERPTSDDTMIVNTSVMTADECADRIVEQLFELGIFGERYV